MSEEEGITVTEDEPKVAKKKRVSRKSAEETEKFPWAEHVSGLKITPKEVEKALHEAGLNSPEDLLKKSAIIEDLIREQAVNLKRELLAAAKLNRS